MLGDEVVYLSTVSPWGIGAIGSAPALQAGG